MGKAHAQRRHAASRANQRLGVRLTRADFDAMVALIQTGQARFLERHSNRVTAFLVFCEKVGHGVPVLYDSERKQIGTMLPLLARELLRSGVTSIDDCPHPK